MRPAADPGYNFEFRILNENLTFNLEASDFGKTKWLNTTVFILMYITRCYKNSGPSQPAHQYRFRSAYSSLNASQWESNVLVSEACQGREGTQYGWKASWEHPVPESNRDVWVIWRENPIQPIPIRVDRMNILAMSDVTRQPETIHIVDLDVDGAGRHIEQ
jgi:hypothetical protein